MGVLEGWRLCPRCGDTAPIHVRLLRYQQTSNGNQEVELAHVTYPGEALRELEALFSGPATSAPEAITPAGSPPAPSPHCPPHSSTADSQNCSP